jgi:hypothetical protein
LYSVFDEHVDDEPDERKKDEREADKTTVVERTAYQKPTHANATRSQWRATRLLAIAVVLFDVVHVSAHVRSEPFDVWIDNELLLLVAHQKRMQLQALPHNVRVGERRAIRVTLPQLIHQRDKRLVAEKMRMLKRLRRERVHAHILLRFAGTL